MQKRASQRRHFGFAEVILAQMATNRLIFLHIKLFYDTFVTVFNKPYCLTLNQLSMKKILMMAVAMMMAVTVNAQSAKGAMAVGGNLNIGIDHGYTNFGIGAKYSYNFIDHLRGEASFDYFFKKDNISQWDINVNLHYVFDLADGKMGLYPLAGFTYIHQHASISYMGYSATANTGNAGFNLGAGWEYRFSEHFKAGAEAKLQWADGSRGVISIGAAYMF